MNKVKLFLDQVKTLKIRTPKPKFNVGDVIINTKYRIISEVMSINNVFETIDGDLEYESAEYVLKDIKNESLVNFMNTHFQSTEMTKQLMTYYTQGTRRRYKKCTNIDVYYNLVDPKAAQVLYGNSTGDKNDKV